jgi:hypothetical protein
MKRSVLITASAIVALAAATPALAFDSIPFSNPYIEFGGGWTSFTPVLTDLESDGNYAPQLDSETHGPSSTFRAAFGGELAPGFRAELGFNASTGSGRFNVSAEGGGSIGVNSSTFAMLGNIWKDFDVGENVSLHIGGGLGAGVVVDSAEGYKGVQTAAGVAYMAGVGATIGLGNGTALTIDYRLNGVAGAPVTGSDYTGWETITGTFGHSLDQSITVGLHIPVGGG